MADITGAPPPFMIGGKTSGGGPKTDIYGVKVINVTTGESANAKTPYVELEFAGHKDKEHPERDGKTVIKQRFYGANPSKSAEDQSAALGRIKNQLFKPLGVSWPKEGKKLEPRLFLNKECFILIGQSKANGEFDPRAEVKRISAERAKLTKALEALQGNVEQSDDGDAEGEEKPAAKKAAGR